MIDGAANLHTSNQPEALPFPSYAPSYFIIISRKLRTNFKFCCVLLQANRTKSISLALHLDHQSGWLLSQVQASRTWRSRKGSTIVEQWITNPHSCHRLSVGSRYSSQDLLTSHRCRIRCMPYREVNDQPILPRKVFFLILSKSFACCA